MTHNIESALKKAFTRIFVKTFFMKRLTLEEVGKMAGVSRSTVSRVVNGYPHISPEIRERVEKIINQTGYQPNFAARSLASSRTQVIGLFIPNTVAHIFSDPYFSRLIEGISRTCNAENHTLALYLFHSLEEEQNSLERILNSSTIDGLIISADRDDSGIIARLQAHQHLPFVMAGRPDDANINYVDTDNFHGAYNAARHLLRLQHRRIGLIATHQNNAGRDRYNGFIKALADQGNPLPPEMIAFGDFSEDSGYHAMKQLLPHKPGAVFASNDLMAFGALRCATEAGLTIPDDLALIGFDDLPAASISSPPLTTVRQHVHRLGSMSVQMLLDVISTRSTVPNRMIIPTELVIRASCGAEQRYLMTE